MEGAIHQGLELYHDRFDMSKVVNENHRFGCVVEIDPYDPKLELVAGKGPVTAENGFPVAGGSCRRRFPATIAGNDPGAT